MKKEYFETKDGMKVYIHPTASHSHRADLNDEVISQVEIGERTFVRETVDLGRVIGVDHLVETSDKERIIFFQRGEQAYKSRMVLDRDPVPTENVTCIVYKCGQEDGQEWDGKYVLISLFEGDPGMPEPYGRYEHDQECIDFWKNHALVPTPEEKKKIVKEACHNCQGGVHCFNSNSPCYLSYCGEYGTGPWGEKVIKKIHY